MKFSITSGLLVLLLAGFSTSCKDRNAPDGEYQSSIDHSFASSEFSSLTNLFDTEATRDSVINGKTTGPGISFCPGSAVTVTVLSSTTASMEVDFGSGCTCLDGRLRTGKLTGVFNGKWKDAGSYVDITPTDYTVNGYALDFNKRITYNGLNSSSNKYWTTVVTDAVIMTSTGNITWESTRETEWAAGDGDTDPSNNEYFVSGTAEGFSRRSVHFTAVTGTDLHVKLNCPHIVAGTFTLSPDGFEPRTIDYGVGGCDNAAVLSVGSWSVNITLP